MPILYARSPSPDRPLPTPQITDADDSIVLSDLVRSGEASRLRRRGAIRENPSATSSTHSHTSSTFTFGRPAVPPAMPPSGPLTFATPSYTPAPPSPPLVFSREVDQENEPPAGIRPPAGIGNAYSSRFDVPYPAYAYRDLDDDYTDSDAGGEGEGDVWEWGRRESAPIASSWDAANTNGLWGVRASSWADRREPPDVEIRLDPADEAAGSFMLFCGGVPSDDGDVLERDEQRPAAPAPRRRPSAFCPAPSTSKVRTKTRPRSNGCGALVHLSAHPRQKYGVWVARGSAGAAENVVGMDASYFDESAVAKMMRSACGCVREGVGCRACGNPLGTIYMPCQAAADGISAPSSPSTPLLRTPSPHGASTSSSVPLADTPSSAPDASIAPPHTPRRYQPLPLRPSGPAYWLPRSQSTSLPASSSASHGTPGGKLVFFTFFADHVRSAPAFAFAPRPITPPRPPPSPQRQPGTFSPFFARQSMFVRRRSMRSMVLRERERTEDAERSDTAVNTSGQTAVQADGNDDDDMEDAEAGEKPDGPGEVRGVMRPER